MHHGYSYGFSIQRIVIWYYCSFFHLIFSNNSIVKALSAAEIETPKDSIEIIHYHHNLLSLGINFIHKLLHHPRPFFAGALIGSFMPL